MAKKIPEKIADFQRDIIARDNGEKSRNKKFEAMDKYFFNDYDEPEELKDEKWFRLVPTTAPSDAVWGATRTLSSIEPALTYAPISMNPKDKEKADKIERVLTSMYRRAGQRSKSKHTRQAVWNAVLYDLVAIQTDFIPFMLQDKNLSAQRKKRLERALRFGPFITNVRNAKNVHSIHSELGLKAVVYEQLVQADDAVHFWGDKKLENMVKDSDIEWVYIVDMMDEDMRYVSAHITTEGSVPSMTNSDKSVSLINGKHGLDFIPWAIKGGGSTTETDPERHYRPMLDSVYHSKQATTVTLLRSLLVSTSVYKYFNPDSVSSTFSGQSPDMGPGHEPGGDVALKVGEALQQLPPDVLDVGMLSLLQMIEEDMQRSTAPRILFGEVPSDIAFATYNAGVQAAARTIIPHKEVAEDALVEVFTHYLLWSQHANEPLTAFIEFENATGDTDRSKYTINPDEIEINTVDMEVELKADIPIDRQARVNTAVMAHSNLPVPARWALDQVGIMDTDLLIAQRQQEDIDNVAIANVGQSLSREFMDALTGQIRQEVLAQIQQEMQQNAESRPDDTAGAPPGA